MVRLYCISYEVRGHQAGGLGDRGIIGATKKSLLFIRGWSFLPFLKIRNK